MDEIDTYTIFHDFHEVFGIVLASIRLQERAEHAWGQHGDWQGMWEDVVRDLCEEEEDREEDEDIYGDVYGTVSVWENECVRKRQERDGDPQSRNERRVHLY